MAILRNNDWKKLIQLCKDQIQKTEGDKRAARGLLYRLTFYISENRLVKPQRREKQEPAIQQTVLFDKFDRGEGSPLSPKEVEQFKIYDHTQLGPGPYKPKDFGHPDCPICKEARDGINLKEPAPKKEEVSE